MTDWPKFVSHKVVQAAPIVHVGPAGEISVQPNEGATEMFDPTEPGMRGHAEVGGYAVIYEDGYKSVSPKKAFEDWYRRQ